MREPEVSKRDNGNVHRAAAKVIVSKSRAARGSVCNVLLSRVAFNRVTHRYNSIIVCVNVKTKSAVKIKRRIINKGCQAECLVG